MLPDLLWECRLAYDADNVSETYLLHNAVNCTLAWDIDAFRLLKLQRLIHPYASICIIAFILCIDLSHGWHHQVLILSDLSLIH